MPNDRDEEGLENEELYADKTLDNPEQVID
jgi:hypothetical protein